MLCNRLEQAGGAQQLALRGALAAGQNHPVDRIVEILGRAQQLPRRAEVIQHGGVLGERALHGEDAGHAMFRGFDAGRFFLRNVFNCYNHYRSCAFGYAGSAVLLTARGAGVTHAPCGPSLAAGGHDGFDLIFVDADHGLTEILGKTCKQLGVLPIGGSLHDGGGTLSRVSGLEDAGTDEHAFGTQLHHERGIGRSGHATGGEVHGRRPLSCTYLARSYGTASCLAASYTSSSRRETSSRICLFMVRM